MKKLKSLFILSLGLLSTHLMAQDTNNASHDVVIEIPEVALLDIESLSGNSITLGPTAPTEAGESLVFPAEDNSLWLNYSSVIGSISEPSRNVSVQITSGAAPTGTVIELLAANDAGAGDGAVGFPTGGITLSVEAQDVITGIGSSYTGDGVNKGHNLAYSLNLASGEGNYASLDFENSETIEITYTLTDN